MTTTCVVQARTGSTRLPGKVLAPVGGMPMLELMLARLGGLAVDEMVVATTSHARDDAIEALAGRAGVAVVRGPEQDVLARFARVLDDHPAETVVRLTADCPLMDPRLVESVIARHHAAGAAYTSNVLPRTFPKGLDVEVIDVSALHAAIDEAADPVEREHVTPFVYRRPERFALENVRSGRALGAERWTVDTAEDLEWLRTTVEAVDDLHAPWTRILAIVGCAAPAPPAGAVVLRDAEGADAGRVLTWRNEPESVRWSASGRAVDSIEHARWYARILDDPGHRVWIAELGSTPVGMVRVDVASGVGTVSIVVAPEQRGHRIGAAMLGALRAALAGDCQVHALVAHVRPANHASVRSFTAAGFTTAGTAPDGLVRLVLRGCAPIEAS